MELNEETGKYYHAADSAEYSIGYRPDHYIEIAAHVEDPNDEELPLPQRPPATAWTYYPELTDTEELYVVLYKMGIPVAEVNLPALFALASV
jgi:hypothetical protein